MPGVYSSTEVQEVWISYVDSVAVLLSPRRSDRPLDQFLPFRDEVLQLVKDETFLQALTSQWERVFGRQKANQPVLGERALYLELQAVANAVEVAYKTDKKRGKRWWRPLLGRASTAVGSVTDLLDSDALPFPLKAGLTLFNEVLDIFKT